MKAVAIGMGICGSLHLLFFTVRLMLFPIELVLVTRFHS